jgi:hypothetical protein
MPYSPINFYPLPKWHRNSNGDGPANYGEKCEMPGEDQHINQGQR